MPTLELSEDERWLIINALHAYDEAIIKCRGQALGESRNREMPAEYRDAHKNLANTWYATHERALALAEKLGKRV